MNRAKEKQRSPKDLKLPRSPSPRKAKFSSIHSNTPKPKKQPPKRSKSPRLLQTLMNRFTKKPKNTSKNSSALKDAPSRNKLRGMNPAKQTRLLIGSFEGAAVDVKNSVELKNAKEAKKVRSKDRRVLKSRVSSVSGSDAQKLERFKKKRNASPSSENEKKCIVSKIHTFFEEKKAGIEKKFGVRLKKKKDKDQLERFKGKFKIEFRSMDRGKKRGDRMAVFQVRRRANKKQQKNREKTNFSKKNEEANQLSFQKSLRTRSFKVKIDKENLNNLNRPKKQSSLSKNKGLLKRKKLLKKLKNKKQYKNPNEMRSQEYKRTRGKRSTEIDFEAQKKESFGFRKGIKSFSREGRKRKANFLGLKLRGKISRKLVQKKKESKINNLKEAMQKEAQNFLKKRQVTNIEPIEIPKNFRKCTGNKDSWKCEVNAKEPNHREMDFIDFNHIMMMNKSKEMFLLSNDADPETKKKNDESNENILDKLNSQNKKNESQFRNIEMKTPKNKKEKKDSKESSGNLKYLENQNAIKRKKKKKQTINRSKSLSELDTFSNCSVFNSKKKAIMDQIIRERLTNAKDLFSNPNYPNPCHSNPQNKCPGAPFKSNQIKLENNVNQNFNYSNKNINNTTYLRCNINIFSSMDGFYKQNTRFSSHEHSDSSRNETSAEEELVPKPRKAVKRRPAENSDQHSLMSKGWKKKKERAAVRKSPTQKGVPEGGLEVDLESGEDGLFVIADNANFKNTFSSSASSVKRESVEIPNSPLRNMKKTGEDGKAKECRVELVSPCVEQELRLHIPIPPRPKQSIMNVDDILSEQCQSPLILKETHSSVKRDHSRSFSKKAKPRPSPLQTEIPRQGECPLESPVVNIVRNHRASQRDPSSTKDASPSPNYPRLLMSRIPTPLIFSHRITQELLDSLKLSYSTPKNLNSCLKKNPDNSGEKKLFFLNSEASQKKASLEKYLNSIGKCIKEMNFISSVEKINSIEKVKQSIAHLEMNMMTRDFGDIQRILGTGLDGTISGRIRHTLENLERETLEKLNLQKLEEVDPKTREKQTGEGYTIQVHNKESTSEVKNGEEEEKRIMNSLDFYDSQERLSGKPKSSEAYCSEEDILIEFSEKNKEKDEKTLNSRDKISTTVFNIFQGSELEKDLLSEKKKIKIEEYEQSMSSGQKRRISFSNKTEKPHAFSISDQKIIPNMTSFSQNMDIEKKEAENMLVTPKRTIDINSFKIQDQSEIISERRTSKIARTSLMEMVNKVDLMGSDILQKNQRSSQPLGFLNKQDVMKRPEYSDEINLECAEMILPLEQEVILETSENDFSTNKNQSAKLTEQKEEDSLQNNDSKDCMPSKEKKKITNIFYDQSLISKETTFSEKDFGLVNKALTNQTRHKKKRSFHKSRGLKNGAFKKKSSTQKTYHKLLLNPMMQFRKIKENCLTKGDPMIPKKTSTTCLFKESFNKNHEGTTLKKQGGSNYTNSLKYNALQTMISENSVDKLNLNSQDISLTSDNIKIHSLAENVNSKKKESKQNYYSSNQLKQEKTSFSKLRSKFKKKSNFRQTTDFSETKANTKKEKKRSFEIRKKKKNKISLFDVKMSMPTNKIDANDFCIYKNKQSFKALGKQYFTKNNFFKKKGGIPNPGSYFQNPRKQSLNSIGVRSNVTSLKTSPRNGPDASSFLKIKDKRFLNPTLIRKDPNPQKLTLNEYNNYTFCENEYKNTLQANLREENQNENIFEKNKLFKNYQKKSKFEKKYDLFTSFSTKLDQFNSNGVKTYKDKSSDISINLDGSSKNNRLKKCKKSGSKKRCRKLHNSKKRILQKKKSFIGSTRNYGKSNHGSIVGDFMSKKPYKTVFREKYSLRQMRSLEKV